jgi:hypothetical protein
MPSQRGLAIGAAAIALVATGCGTTVSNTAASGAGAPAADGLSVPTTAGTATTGPGGSATGATTAPGTIGGTTTGGRAGPTTTPPSGQYGGTEGLSPAGASAPGVTGTKIYVGMLWDKSQDSVNRAAGAGGIAIGDVKADANAIIDDINKHGGIAGRTVVPVWQSADSASAQTIDTQLAAACDHFAHDERVFAVIGAERASYRACLANNGIVQLDEGLPDIGDAEFAKYPALVELGYPRLSRVAKAMLQALPAQNYFSPWNTATGGPAKTGRAKVGILTVDSPGFDVVVDNILIPGLKRLGYDPGSDVARIGVAANASDITNQAAANQSAELKFAQDRVTHVVVFESNGGNSLLFMNQAESQHYRPRYGVNSGSGLQVLVDAVDVQPQQAVGAVGFGWIPAYDLTAAMNPDNGRYSNDERRNCIAIFKRHGITFSNPNAEYAALSYCSTLHLLRVALDTTPKVVTPATFVAAIDGLHSGYTAPAALGTYLGPGQHDAVSKGYYWRWFDACKCLHYAGALRTIPS